MVDYHLVVLVHGLWGNPSHLLYIEKQLESHFNEQALQQEQVVIYKTGSHSGFLTYDGIDVNGKRIADEILRETVSLSNNTASKNRVTKFLIIGYSLGGLISRFALGILYFQKYFDNIEPINFISFCSPHVGVLAPGENVSVKLFNKIVPHFLAHSGYQLFLKDSKIVSPSSKLPNVNDLPLLVWMAETNSVFFKALQKFKYRSLYANIVNDKRTCWFTSAIEEADPFNSMSNENPSAYKLDYIKNYEPTVIDFSKPICYEKAAPPTLDKFDQASKFQKFLIRKFNWLKVLGNLLLFTPLWSVFFIGSSLFQRFKLNRRVNDFFKDGSNSLIYLYDFINEDSNNNNYSFDDLEIPKNLLNSNENNDYLESLGKEINNTIKDQTDTFVESVYDAMNSEYTDSYSVHNRDKLKETSLKPNSDEFKLELTSQQNFIIEKLNTLSWNKFPILIRNTKAAHAAAIVRYQDDKFEEGKTVVNHFVNEVFQLS